MSKSVNLSDGKVLHSQDFLFDANDKNAETANKGVSKKEEDLKAREKQRWLYYTRAPLTDSYRDNLYKEYYSVAVHISFRGNDNDKMLGVGLSFIDNSFKWQAKISNLESFLFSVVSGEMQVINSNEITIEPEDLCATDAKLVRFLDSVFREGEHHYENSKLWLKNSAAEDFITLAAEHENVFAEGKPAQIIQHKLKTFIKGVINEEGALQLNARLDFDGFVNKYEGASAKRIEADYSKIITFGKDCSYIFYRNGFYPTAPSFPKTQRDYFSSPVLIEAKYMKDFYARVLPSLRKDFSVELPDIFPVDDGLQVFPANAVVFLDYDGRSVFATIRYKYGKYSVDPYTGEISSSSVDIANIRLYRDEEKEEFFCKTLERYLDRSGDYSFETSDDEKIFYLSYKALPMLQDKGWTFFYSEAFRSLKINVKPPAMKVKLTSDINFFEIAFTFEGVEEAVDVSELMKEDATPKEYIRLQNGSFVPVDLEVMDCIAKLFNETSSERGSDDSYLLPLFNAPYLVDELEKSTGVELEISANAQHTLRDIKRVEYDDELPKDLQGTPRPYQLTGYNWLRKLANMNLHGILADDMGLGKSFQTIATILREKELGAESPSLIVCPTSCVFNWYMEIEKFAPSLNCAVVQGKQDKRNEIIRTLSNYDVAVTSYSSLRRDVKRYQQITFNYIILDEAQHIKNANTQNAKAAKAMNSLKRLVLTGTPMENSISELWSIFDFLMPGFFPKHKVFSEKYEAPILSDGSEEALAGLKKKIAPFILRRLKKDVLKDLPPKNTSVIYCEPTPSQKELYISILEAARLEIFDAVKRKGFNNAKIEIFSALTRLRQVCCHPKLLEMKQRGEANSSGKFNLFMEMIHETIDGGHNVIVFSQFTRMLKLIKSALDKKGIPHLYLDGATSDRMDLVNRFNAGEAPIFLLSLKAAGTGLTLTKADTVMHFDLWWNPAVEDQATDRAYRMGQKREVTNYKLVTKGTIEEKILALQERKRELIDSVIGENGASAGKISWEEVQSLLQ